jgi:DNA polymerase-1
MRLFLFDGTALIFRSFHAFSGRASMSSRGIDVGMTFGFLSTLFSVLRKEKPDRLALCFDTGEPTFRHQQYESYKANRPPLDESLRVQLPMLDVVIDSLKIPNLKLPGYEADDIIGTLARQGAEKGMEVFIVSGDKDFMQLVGDNISLYKLPKGAMGDAPEVINKPGVFEKFGVEPERVIDVLGLMGDAVDNVPGIPGVGEKTAIQLIQRFGSVEETLARASEVERPKLRESLIQFADQARLSKELVIINTAVPIKVTPESLTFGPLNNPEARSRLVDLEFRNLLQQVESLTAVGSSLLFPETAQIELPEVTKGSSEGRDYHLIRTVEDLSRLVMLLESGSGLVAMDTETTSLDAMRADLVGLSFSLKEGEAYYIAVNAFEGVPMEFLQPAAPPLRPRITRETSYILDCLKPFFTDPNRPKCGQNLKYDLLVLACYDIEVTGVVFDTMLASHILDSSARLHGIDHLAEVHLGIRKIPTTSLIGSGAKQTSMADADVEKVSEYACEDADVALRLSNLLSPRIKSEGFEKIFDQQELPLMPVLLQMEKTGVALDTRLLMTLSGEFQSEMEHLVEEVHELAGMPFNLNSTQQLADVLFNRLGLPPGRKTKFGFSTDIDELERLAYVHELPAKLLRFRHLSKLKSTYIDALPQMIHPITRRVHTSYSQTIAATGRLSSTDPNLQNIPIRSEEGGRIRKAFVAGEPGWKMLSADYSQIELRIMAHLSGDERMKEAFLKGWDIHRSTAAWMNSIPPEEVTSDQRRQAKEVNFGVLYGMGEFGLSQRLGISRSRAREFIDAYFNNFSQVKRFIDKLIADTKQNEYVSTMMGRRRPIPDINSKNFTIRSNAERVAINTPIQGSAADLIKLAMIRVHERLRSDRFRARMLLQVHDELVFEAPESEIEPLSKMLVEVMSTAMDFSVPIEVGVGWGESWLEAHD